MDESLRANHTVSLSREMTIENARLLYCSNAANGPPVYLKRRKRRETALLDLLSHVFDVRLTDSWQATSQTIVIQLY